MFRATLLAAATTAALAPALHAEEHEIVMLGLGYFPETTYAAIGDTLVFLNVADSPMAATATDGSWSTGLLTKGQSVSVPVSDGMTGSFANIVADLSVLDGTVEAVDGLLGTAGDALLSEETDTGLSIEETVSTVEAYGYVDYTNPPPLN